MDTTIGDEFSESFQHTSDANHSQYQHDNSTSCQLPQWRLENREYQRYSMEDSVVPRYSTPINLDSTHELEPPKTPKPRHTRIMFDPVRNADQVQAIQGIGLHGSHPSRTDKLSSLNSGVDADAISQRQEASILELQRYEALHPGESLDHYDWDNRQQNGVVGFMPGRLYLGDSMEEDQELLARAMRPDSGLPPGIVADKFGRWLQYDREAYGAWRDACNREAQQDIGKVQSDASKASRSIHERRAELKVETPARTRIQRSGLCNMSLASEKPDP